MKIQIIRANYWYINELGNIFDDVEIDDKSKSYKVKGNNGKESTEYIAFEDAKIIENEGKVAKVKNEVDVLKEMVLFLTKVALKNNLITEKELEEQVQKTKEMM